MKYKNWDNVNDWTADIPMNLLPFFVWCKATNVNINDIFLSGIFDSIFNNFITEMGLNIKNIEEFRNWCYEQYVHYYECNH
jgi:hypothetical protein